MISGYPYAVINSFLLRKAGITRDTRSRRRRELRIPSPRATGALAFQAVYQLPPPPQLLSMSREGHSWGAASVLSEGCA